MCAMWFAVTFVAGNNSKGKKIKDMLRNSLEG